MPENTDIDTAELLLSLLAEKSRRINRKNDRSCRLLVAIAAIFILFAILPAASASMEKMTLQNMTKEADLIVIGDIKEVESKWSLDKLTIFKHSTLSIDKYIKGNPGQGTVTIISEGGTIGSLYVWVDDAPTFAKDEKVLVFLKKSGDEYSVVGMTQGKFILRNGVLFGKEGEKTPLKEFLSQVEDIMVLNGDSPSEEKETPGFESVQGLLGLLAVLCLSKKK